MTFVGKNPQKQNVRRNGVKSRAVYLIMTKIIVTILLDSYKITTIQNYCWLVRKVAIIKLYCTLNWRHIKSKQCALLFTVFSWLPWTHHDVPPDHIQTPLRRCYSCRFHFYVYLKTRGRQTKTYSLICQCLTSRLSIKTLKSRVVMIPLCPPDHSHVCSWVRAKYSLRHVLQEHAQLGDFPHGRKPLQNGLMYNFLKVFLSRVRTCHTGNTRVREYR